MDQSPVEGRTTQADLRWRSEINRSENKGVYLCTGNVESSNESDAVLQNHAQPLEKQPGDMEQWKSGIRSASDQFLFWFSRGKALKSASDCRT